MAFSIFDSRINSGFIHTDTTPVTIANSMASKGKDAPPWSPKTRNIWTISDHTPVSFPENGILKITIEKITPIKPANAELKKNHITIEVANLPAKPRFTRVAQAGLNAAKIKIGTSDTKNFIIAVVPEAINANASGKKPPSTIPITSANSVHT